MKEILMQYTPVQWLLFFYLYCFLGWIFESCYVSIMERKLTNRGFLNGPVIPIYGVGAIVIVSSTIPFRGQYLQEFLVGMMAATALEYVIGLAMESIFKMRYWDYSHKPCNLKGYICLESSICWGVLSVVAGEILQTELERFVSLFSITICTAAAVGFTVIFLIDLCGSVREAWGLRNILLAIEKAKKEIADLQETIEERLEQERERLLQEWNGTREEIGQRKEDLARDLHELKMMVEQERQLQRELIHEVRSIVAEGREMLVQLTEAEKAEFMEKMARAKAERDELLVTLASRKNGLLRRNPGATSAMFTDSLQWAKANLYRLTKEDDIFQKENKGKKLDG